MYFYDMNDMMGRFLRSFLSIDSLRLSTVVVERVVLIEREKKNDTSLALSINFLLFFSCIHTCQLMVNNTDVNFEDFQL